MRPLLGKLWEAHQVVTMARPASTFYCGQGMQGGVDMTVIHGFLRRLRRQGKFREAGMLECAVSGATWPQARRQQEGYCDSGMCPHQGCEADETQLHRVWLCKQSIKIMTNCTD